MTAVNSLEFTNAVLDHVWQSSLFALIVIAALALLRGAPARVRYALWVSIPLKFLVPSSLLSAALNRVGLDLSGTFLSMAWASGDPLAFAKGQDVALHMPSSLVRQLPESLQPFVVVAFGIWVASSLAMALIWILRQSRLYREIHNARKMDGGKESIMVAQLAKRLQIRRKIRIVSSADFTEVGVWGVWRPWILLPEDISNHLSESEMEAILLHELVHVARWDNLLGHVSMSACCLFWFHPLVWFADRRIVMERERVCDDRVLELGSACRTYAAGLVKVLRFGLGFRVAGVSCAGGAHLKRRIEQIASGEPAPRLSIGHRLAVFSVLIALIVVSMGSVKIDRSQVDPAYRKPAKGCSQSN